VTPDSKYLRAADIVRLTGISIRTVRRWIADEIIPSCKLGGARLVAREDLESRLCSSPDPVKESDEVGTKHDGDSRSCQPIGKA
jgi:excisionase family DNA binding protein